MKSLKHRLRRRARSFYHDLRLRADRKHLFEVEQPSERSKVIVVGAGIAGLVTAYLLEKHGHEVLLIEAASQAGGRVSTIREAFSGDLYADTGGFRFEAEHHLMRELVRQLNLPTDSFYPKSGRTILYLDGTVQYRKIGDPFDRRTIKRALTDEEKWMLDQETEGTMYRIKGGVDRITQGLLSRIDAKVELSAKVRAVRRHGGEYSVEYVQDGDHQTVNADHVVMAMPFGVLKEIEFNPGLSVAKWTSITEMKYRTGLLVYFEMPKEYWLEQNLTGFGVTDTIGELWTFGMDLDSKMCVTMSYTKDKEADELLRMSQAERLATIRMRCNDFLPWFSDFVSNEVSISWDEDVLIRGTRSAAVFSSPEQMQVVRRPEGNIHFAGEHTAENFLCWMEGAIESAIRVAREINRGEKNEISRPDIPANC